MDGGEVTAEGQDSGGRLKEVRRGGSESTSLGNHSPTDRWQGVLESRTKTTAVVFSHSRAAA